MQRKRAAAHREETTGKGVEALLISVARDYFAERGYADASLNMIVDAAGLTKGAVYHYFSNKQDLFRAVYSAEQRRLVRTVVAAFRAEPDAWEAFHAGIRAFVHELLDASVRRILLMDAPVALSWQEMRESLRPTGVDLVREGLVVVQDAGLISGHRVDLLANLVYGAVCEAAHVVGNAPEPDAMIDPVLDELRLTLDRLVDRTPVPLQPALLSS